MNYSALLARHGIAPILVDIGASGTPPRAWRSIAAPSTLLGFDPDLREAKETGQGAFHRTVLLDMAVTADASATIDFRLTRYPHCSSVLQPATAALANYQHADYFQVEKTVPMRATNLAAALARAGLAGIDWLKIDTQGTDLRLFNSLPDAVRNEVLALDVEPHLMDSYRGEDKFGATHENLLQQGLWLSRLEVRGLQRVSVATLETVKSEWPAAMPALGSVAMRQSPGWAEARYLRSVQSLQSANAPAERYILLWVLAQLDEQVGYALEVALAVRADFGAVAAQELIDLSLEAIKARQRAWRRHDLKVLPFRALNKVRSALRREG